MAIKALIPPPAINFEHFAADHIVFEGHDAVYEGPYDPDLFPFFAEILSALEPTDPCRDVTLMKSAQIGGTVLANIFVLATMYLRPCNFLVTHPTVDGAERWIESKLQPMLDNVPELSEQFAKEGNKKSAKKLLKQRKDGRGTLFAGGAHSSKLLSQITVKSQVKDDLSKWEDIKKGGDPEKLANSRMSAIEDGKCFNISTPLTLPECRISKNFEKGTQERYYVPCPHCEFMQVLEWKNFQANIDPENLHQSHFTCVECGEAIYQKHRDTIVAKGEWRAANPAAASYHRSFAIWSAYARLVSWDRIARDWLDSKGEASSEKTFLNDQAGIAYEIQGDAPPYGMLMERAKSSSYAFNTVPKGCYILTLGVDVQKDYLDWQLIGYGPRKTRFVIATGEIPGHISDPDAQKWLDKLISNTWPNYLGHQIPIRLTAIDGNNWTHDVAEWADGHSSEKVIMVRGRHGVDIPIVELVKRKNRAYTGKIKRFGHRWFNFDASALKQNLYMDLRKEDPNMSGYIDFPKIPEKLEPGEDALDEEYFLQVTAERCVEEVNKKTGRIQHVWQEVYKRNEKLDTFNQSWVAAYRAAVFKMDDEDWQKYALKYDTPPNPQGDLEDLILDVRVNAPQTSPAPEKSEQDKMKEDLQQRIRELKNQGV